MAEFLKDSKLVSAIEELIDKADKELWLISPYIKFDGRIKDRLRLKKQCPSLHIVIVFGKNEEDTSKSLSKEDFEFLKDFPSITVGYEPRLHAKYYSSEDFSIITSMNLHQYSLHNNIEVGIKLKSKKWFQQASKDGEADYDAAIYFDEVVQNCTIIFDKDSVMKKGVLGFGEVYSHSEIKTDDSETFFIKKDSFVGKKYFQSKVVNHGVSNKQGYCIRTAKPIPFNPKRPMCDEVLKVWNKFRDVNYPEKYCHYSGEPSNGETSFNKPILRKNWSKAK